MVRANASELNKEFQQDITKGWLLREYMKHQQIMDHDKEKLSMRVP